MSCSCPAPVRERSRVENNIFYEDLYNSKDKQVSQATISLAQQTAGRRKYLQAIMFYLFRMAAVINALALMIILFFLIKNGWRAINWTFFKPSRRLIP